MLAGESMMIWFKKPFHETNRGATSQPLTMQTTPNLPTLNFITFHVQLLLSTQQSLWSMCCILSTVLTVIMPTPRWQEQRWMKSLFNPQTLTSLLLFWIFHACVTACDSHVAPIYFCFFSVHQFDSVDRVYTEDVTCCMYSMITISRNTNRRSL